MQSELSYLKLVGNYVYHLVWHQEYPRFSHRVYLWVSMGYYDEQVYKHGLHTRLCSLRGGNLTFWFLLRDGRNQFDNAMIRAVSLRPFAAESGFRFEDIPCENYCGESGTRTDFHPNTSFFSPDIIIPPIIRTHLHVALTRRTKGRSQGMIQKRLSQIEKRWI